MFGIGSSEFIVIIVVAVLVLGPEHLPRIMRTVTKVMSDFRRISTELQRVINLESFEAEDFGKKNKGTKKRATAKTTKKKPSSGKKTEAAGTTTAASAQPETVPAPAENGSSPTPIPDPYANSWTEQPPVAPVDETPDSPATAKKDDTVPSDDGKGTSASEPSL